jgi:hypothetical protein
MMKNPTIEADNQRYNDHLANLFPDDAFKSE